MKPRASHNSTSDKTQVQHPRHEQYQQLMEQEVARFQEAHEKGETFELQLFYSPTQSAKDIEQTSAAFHQKNNGTV